MASVKSHAQDASMSVDEPPEASPERSDPRAEHHDDTEREPFSQPLVNFPIDAISSQDSECSQAPTSGATVAVSQQSSPEFLTSLGVKVRDFAYENTLPAIVPVPRVPRQVQPAPRTLKRSHRDWDSREGPSNSLFQVRALPGQTTTKKPGFLERKATEPLQEPVVQHTRTLERITVKRVCSILTPPSRNNLPTTPRTRFSSASPPTSPLTPLPSHFVSQESELVQSSSTFPFVVHVDDPSAIPAPQLDSQPQPVSLRPILYTRFTLESRRSPGHTPAARPSQNTSPAPLASSYLEVTSSTKESGAGSLVRRRRARGTPPSSNRYQLRQRPVPSPYASTIPHLSHQANSPSKPLSRRNHRVR